MAVSTLIIGTDNLAEIDALQNAVSSAYINNATCSVTLYDQSGTEVTGETWPLTMSYVAASNGDYRATITDTVTANLSPNKRYRMLFKANGGAGLYREWHVWVNAIRG
jgi:hypothetical protein